MGGKRRDRAAEQAAITAAAERLLAATPLRSETGKLTVSELITESGLRRDIVYDHPQLIDAFKGRAKARGAQPAALTALAGERDELRAKLAAVREDLAREQRTASTLRKVVAELSLELDQAREELTSAGNVTPIRAARNGSLPGSARLVLSSKHATRCAAPVRGPGPPAQAAAPVLPAARWSAKTARDANSVSATRSGASRLCRRAPGAQDPIRPA